MADVAVDPIEVGKRYDESSPISDVLNDGQVHMSYWYGEEDRTPLAEAAQRITRKVVDALGLRPGERVLDAGCGVGAPAILIAQETGARVTGITVSNYELAQAKQKAKDRNLHEQVDFQYADYMALPFADGSFDAVLAVESLQCAPQLDTVLSEFMRVLRPGGRVTVADYTREREMSVAEAEEFATSIGINTPPTQRDWIEKLTASGFRVEEHTQCGARVFGMTEKYVDSAVDSREKLAQFGSDIVVGLEAGLRHFMAPGPDRIGYALVTARKPVLK